jgi:hypothetical protein
MLTGDGLKVAQLTAEAMLKSAMKGDDLDRVRSLAKVTEQLNALAEKEGGA